MEYEIWKNCLIYNYLKNLSLKNKYKTTNPPVQRTKKKSCKFYADTGQTLNQQWQGFEWKIFRQE